MTKLLALSGVFLVVLSSFSGCGTSQTIAEGGDVAKEELKLCGMSIGHGVAPQLPGKWMLAAYSASDMASAVCKPEGVPGMSLTFQGDGKMKGQSSCNSLGASYQAKDGTMELDGLFYTEMLCGDSEGTLMSWENHFLRGLEATTGYEILGNCLWLKTNNNKDLFLFSAH